jgi:hypothetical protein
MVKKCKSLIYANSSRLGWTTQDSAFPSLSVAPDAPGNVEKSVIENAA